MEMRKTVEKANTENQNTNSDNQNPSTNINDDKGYENNQSGSKFFVSPLLY